MVGFATTSMVGFATAAGLSALTRGRLRDVFHAVHTVARELRPRPA